MKMFEKKKIQFWRLAFLFAGFTILTLFFLWNTPSEPKAQMMTDSMGSMMKQMHLSNVNIYDLFAKGEQGKMASSMQEMNSHHDVPKEILRLNFLTTAFVFLSLPLIVGGSIVLAIVWKNNEGGG